MHSRNFLLTRNLRISQPPPRPKRQFENKPPAVQIPIPISSTSTAHQKAIPRMSQYFFLPIHGKESFYRATPVSWGKALFSPVFVGRERGGLPSRFGIPFNLRS